MTTIHRGIAAVVRSAPFLLLALGVIFSVGAIACFLQPDSWVAYLTWPLAFTGGACGSVGGRRLLSRHTELLGARSVTFTAGEMRRLQHWPTPWVRW